jgi:predicted RNase H-like HicB family nuclease
MLLMPKYIRAALCHAQYETIEEDGSIFATIPGFDGLWANAPTKTEVDEELASALEGWLLVGIAHHHPIPVIGRIDLALIHSTHQLD